MSIYNHRTMILAGDVGGTKTLIGLFAYDKRRPSPIDVRSYPTTEFPGLPAIIEAFYRAQPERPSVTNAAFGVAGPVIDQHVVMTNVDWAVDAAELEALFGFRHVKLLNDLESMANSLTVLEADELRTLQAGSPDAEGNIALIAAGTGLGQAVLHSFDGRHVPMASEGGHADFAARTDRELALVQYLRGRYERAELERVLSGPGLVNLSDFTHHDGVCAARGPDGGLPDSAAAVSSAALAGQCGKCGEALDLFVSAYGAAAGNLALTAVTTGGVFVGGGISPRILPALENGRFIAAFNSKDPMRSLLEAMPVHVILNPQSGLLGAAVSASKDE